MKEKIENLRERLEFHQKDGFISIKVPVDVLAAVFAELDALRGLDVSGIDELLARWDKTDPHIQRDVIARLAGLAAEAKGRPMDQAPKDGTLFLCWAPGRDGLPAMFSLCAWHPDTGFCIDELRQPELWWALPTPYREPRRGCGHDSTYG